jgi:hypothetical protein
VDVTAECPTALEWLGRFMALLSKKPYDRTVLDGAQRAKEALAGYRGATCGSPLRRGPLGPEPVAARHPVSAR